MPQLVITAVGPDRAGLVDELTGYLLTAGANVGDSRMVHLGGQFALILAVEAGEQELSAVRASLPGVGLKMGLTVSVSSPAAAEQAAAAPGRAVPYRVKVYAMDQPGIVHKVTHLLHGFGANIEELTTDLEPGAYTGTPVFTMELTMAVPTTVQVTEVRKQLAALCESLNCDVDLQPA